MIDPFVRFIAPITFKVFCGKEVLIPTNPEVEFEKNIFDRFISLVLGIFPTVNNEDKGVEAGFVVKFIQTFDELTKRVFEMLVNPVVLRLLT